MRFSNTLAILIVSCTASHGWILDQSCNSYSQMVTTGMQSAFDLAQAGSDAMGDLAIAKSINTNTLTAQRDLVSYLFAESMTGGKIDPTTRNWQSAASIFSRVLAYNTGQPGASAASYRALPSSEVILFCDYSRFKENVDCLGNPKPGYVCDTTMGVFWPISSIYSNCKSTSSLKLTSVEVSGSK